MNNPELNHIIFCYGSNMCEYEMLKYSNRLKNNKTNHFELLDIGVLDNYKFVYRNICLPTIRIYTYANLYYTHITYNNYYNVNFSFISLE